MSLHMIVRISECVSVRVKRHFVKGRGGKGERKKAWRGRGAGESEKKEKEIEGI